MKEPNDFPPIVYNTKLKLRVNIKSEKKEKIKNNMDEIVSKQFLKNYFSLMTPSK